jgi:hypothetical protein
MVILAVNMFVKKRLEYPSHDETAGPPVDAALVYEDATRGGTEHLGRLSTQGRLRMDC